MVGASGFEPHPQKEAPEINHPESLVISQRSCGFDLTGSPK